MADVATARREARRRKILENSHNRLQLISGKNDNDFCKASPIKAQIPEPIYENSVPVESSSTNQYSLNNGVISTEIDSYSSLSTRYENSAIGDGDVNTHRHDIASLTSTTPDPPTSTPLFEKLANYKYDIVILSLLIQLLYTFSLVTLEHTYFFLPLLLYVSTKSVLYPRQQNSNIANALLLLNGILDTRVQKLMSVTQWISAFSQDVCVFLFTTICTQSLWQTLRDTFA